MEYELAAAKRLRGKAVTITESWGRKWAFIVPSNLDPKKKSDIHFTALWFGFVAVPIGVTEDDYTARLAEASSVYLVDLVVT